MEIINEEEEEEVKEEEEEEATKRRVNVVTRQRKQLSKYVGRDAGPVALRMPPAQSLKAMLFHPLPSPWNLPKRPNLGTLLLHLWPLNNGRILS